MNKVEVLNEDKIGKIVSKVIAEMSNNKIEKNHHYPSELNTKSIACRIPMADYLEFNKEAKNNGMNMNDWLLDKLYNSDRNSGTINGKNKNEKTINSNNETIELTIDDFSHYFKNEFIHTDYIQDVQDEFCLKYSKSDVAELCWHIIRKQRIIEGYKNHKKEASIEDVKNQITILVGNKFETPKARKSFLRDVLPLLKELE